MKIKPLRDRVLVKKDEAEDTYKGTSIVLPDQLKEKPQTGEVIAVGPGLVNLYGTYIGTTLSPGDKILFPKHCGVDLKSLEDGLFIVPEADVLGIIEPETVD